MTTIILLRQVFSKSIIKDVNKLTVLIVDDAPFIRDILRRLLTRAGHEVVGEAEDGVQAVAMATEKKPQLVIMDIVMPRMSGVQATKEILASLPETKVIACSTLDQDNMLMKVMEAGAVEYIKKPFNAPDVIAIIDRVFFAEAKDER
jgi:two-component system chemotaxis response regulator CheY